MEEALVKGYIEMSAINLDLAKEGESADYEAWELSEESLTECE